MRPRLGGRGRQREGLYQLAGRVVEDQAARQAVDARRLQAPGAAGRQAGEADEYLGDQCAASYRTRCRFHLAAAVGQHHRVLGQDAGQGIHVEIAYRVVEGAEQALAFLIRHFATRVVGLDVVPRAAGQLTAGSRAALEAAPDLVEVQVEHIVQQEGRAFQRRQPLQREHEGDGNVLGELGLRLRVGRPAGVLVQQRFGQPDADIVLALRGGRAELVQAQIGHQPREVGAGMLDGALVHLGPAQPGLLHDVLGLGARAEHAVGERAQTARVFTVVAQSAFVECRHDAGSFQVQSGSDTSRRNSQAVCDRQRPRRRRSASHAAGHMRGPVMESGTRPGIHYV